MLNKPQNRDVGRTQGVKKFDCLCEKARKGEATEDTGDRFCDLVKMVNDETSYCPTVALVFRLNCLVQGMLSMMVGCCSGDVRELCKQ